MYIKVNSETLCEEEEAVAGWPALCVRREQILISKEQWVIQAEEPPLYPNKVCENK